MMIHCCLGVTNVRDEQHMKDLLLDLALADERIRAVVLQGSRADADASPDQYSDYDVLFAVTNQSGVDALRADLSWLDALGQPAVRQTSDDQFFGGDPDRYICMTQYTDGSRVDLSLVTVDKLLDHCHEPSLLWLDKDGGLSLPDVEPYSIKRPDTQLFHGCTNEFWWVAPYVAKGICRQQLPYAQAMLTLIRDELRRMLGWQLACHSAIPLRLGCQAKYLQKHLTPAAWKAYQHTYAASDYPSLWHALFAACRLFRTAATDVAQQLHYPYPQQDDDRVSVLLQTMRKQAEADLRAVACAFTGRRPQSLPWGYDDSHPDAVAFAARLRSAIEQAYRDGYRNFICGMAQGIDLLACEQAIALKQSTCPDIVLVAAVPGKDQTKHWSPAQIDRYDACLEHCDVRRIMAQFSDTQSYHMRNRWMVDHASRLIAVWEGLPTGGTGRTVAYANKNGLDIIALWPETGHERPTTP